ncbi:hypothetical protein AJ80_00033 [Polytolypa hystricis UAMH7299]|uniref:Ecp2 effector protein domain-containing protein n=1 Tax=Polytolypa hystricis (strain UAMH7299) TaxID=1447883 RepID=A0A2B7Z4I1_POLH7|nr:hypothetical protein AJ80_00033 [Polytolypa hystricis UAMH7299]
MVRSPFFFACAILAVPAVVNASVHCTGDTDVLNDIILPVLKLGGSIITSLAMPAGGVGPLLNVVKGIKSGASAGGKVGKLAEVIDPNDLPDITKGTQNGEYLLPFGAVTAADADTIAMELCQKLHAQGPIPWWRVGHTCIQTVGNTAIYLYAHNQLMMDTTLEIPKCIKLVKNVFDKCGGVDDDGGEISDHNVSAFAVTVIARNTDCDIRESKPEDIVDVGKLMEEFMRNNPRAEPRNRRGGSLIGHQ